MISAWQLGWRTLRRDLRAGELRLLIVAVALAVSALTAVGFFADRLTGGLARDARKAGPPGYPLRGNLTVAVGPQAAGTLTRDIPPRGQAWVDAPLLEALG